MPITDLLNYPGRDLLQMIRKEAVEIIESCDNYTIFFMNTGPGKLQVSEQEFNLYKD